MSINKAVIIGRLGADPEVRHTPAGQSVCNFSVATSESWTDKAGAKQERTEWHRIVVWGKLGELCGEYLAKGRQAYIEGKLQTRSWEDDQGVKKYTTEILGQNVQFLGDAPQSGQGRPAPSQAQPNQGGSPAPAGDQSFTADDIPF